VLPDPIVSIADLAAAGLVVEPGPAADVSACAGRPGCAKALADVRADVLAGLSQRSSGGSLPAGRMHVSGCERRCGAPRGPHVDAVALAGGGYLVDGIARTGLG
jgi:precorrin-3B synthase